MPKINFSLPRNRGIIFATLLFVITLGAAYFFAYVPNNQQSLEEKQYRCLQNAAQNISDKIDNSLATLNNLLTSYQPPTDKLKPDNKKLVKYIDKPTKNFRLTIDTDYKRVKAEVKAGSTPPPVSDTSITVNGQTLSIHVIKQSANIGLSYTFKQFIEPLLPQKIFDQYLVFHGQDLIYQSFQSGITGLPADSLKKDKSAFSARQVKDISLSGTSYKFFSQQLNIKPGDAITLVGLLSNEHYTDEKNKLPEQVVLLLLLLASAGILALPWIKLYQMGSNDRMTAADGLCSLAVPMLLMSVLFFAFSSYNASFRPGLPAAPAMAKNLAETIKLRFSSEIENTYSVLSGVAAICTPEKGPANAGAATHTPPAQNAHAWNTAALAEITKELSVNQVYQLDENGIETGNWTPGAESPPRGNYSNREYFTRLKEQKPLYMHADRSQPFYTEPVISRTTNAFTTVLSMPSANKGAPYTAISFNVKCLHHAILTPGFLYAIIDGQGKVLYHSDTTKQLNENLLKELTAQETLKATIDAHTDTFFVTKYSGKQYNAYVSPFASLPYHIVIMEDQSLTNVRLINNFVFSFSMLLAFFIVLAAELLLVFIVSVKKQSYKKHYFDVSWVGPNKKFNQEYILAVCGNTAIILLVCLFLVIGDSPFLENVFIMLTASSTAYLLLNLLYARAYKNVSAEQHKAKNKAVITLSILIILFNVVAAVLTNVYNLLFFELALFDAIAILWLLYIYTPFKNRISQRPAGDFCKSFSVMTFTRMIITSGLPVLVFYIASFNYEVKLSSRYQHTQFTKAIKRQYALAKDSVANANIYNDGVWINRYAFIPKKDTSGGGYHPSVLFRMPTAINTVKHGNTWMKYSVGTLKICDYGNWIKNYAVAHEKPRITTNEDEHRTAALFGSLTVNNDKLVPGISALGRTTRDSSWLYTSFFYADDLTGHKPITYHHLANQSYFEVFARSLDYTLPRITFDKNWYRGLSYWVLLILALAGFWYLLYKVLRRLFALNIPSDKYWEDIDELLLQDGALNPLVFLIGSPGSGKLTKVIKLVEEGKIKGINETDIIFNSSPPELFNYFNADIFNSSPPEPVSYFIADMILIPNDAPAAGAASTASNDWDEMRKQATDPKYKLVIVNHFEYDIKNASSNKLKLTFLEDLLQKKLSKVFIISTVHPINFLDSLNQQTAAQIAAKTQAATSDRSPEHDLERWHVLLGHFKIAIEKLDDNNIDISDLAPGWEKTLFYETRSGHFLNDMRAPIDTRLNQPGIDQALIDPEGLALKLGITSHYFYMYMWQSLTKEEKFLLYDLAEDGLVNPFDDYNLILLISKGLVIRGEDGILRIFNNGFRNFILTAIGSSEADQIQKQIKDNGNWSKLKTPLVILIIALLAFLFTSQQEAYTTLIKYVSIITIGVPAILKVFSLFGTNDSKPV